MMQETLGASHLPLVLTRSLPPPLIFVRNVPRVALPQVFNTSTETKRTELPVDRRRLNNLFPFWRLGDTAVRPLVFLLGTNGGVTSVCVCVFAVHE